MQLLVQVVGALAAGLLIWALARSSGLRGRRAVGTIAVIAIVAGALLGPPNLRSAIVNFVHQRDYDESLTDAEAKELPGGAIEADTGFLDWAAERIGPGEQFQLVVGHEGRNPLLSQWALFRLEPREGITIAAPGGWVVLYDVVPSRYKRPIYEEVQVYKPGFAIARAAG
jgi:hypothetical protein